MENNERSKCPKCKHEQDLNYYNVFQDIEGYYTICGKCLSTYGVEIGNADELKK